MTRGAASACLAAKAIGAVLAACLALGLASGLVSCASTAAPSAVAQEWFDLGNAWLEKGDWKRAGQAYSHALALDPHYAGASFNLARAFTESGDYDRALQALDALAKNDPGNVKIMAARAYTLYKKGDAKAALAAYREVIALDQFSPDAVYNTALLELSSGAAAAAVDDLNRLTTANPDDGQAFLLLGRAIDRRAADAIKAANAAKAAPGSKAPASAAAAPGPAADATAEASILTDDESAALSAYETARTLGKADAEALERIAGLYEKEQLYTDAMDALEAALKADPKRASAAFSLARLRLVIAGDSDKGLAALKTALDAGFADKDAAAALLAEPDLPERQKVYDLLKTKDLAE